VSYTTPAAFKQALEARLRAEAAATRRDLARVRQLLVFERFLSRVFAAFGESVVLEGGVVLELRLARARTTRDIDLRASGDPAKILAKLREACALSHGDWLQFFVRPDAAHPEMKGEGVIYDGRRFRVEAQLAGRLEELDSKPPVAARQIRGALRRRPFSTGVQPVFERSPCSACVSLCSSVRF
jgi:hypothetical protein